MFRKLRLKISIIKQINNAQNNSFYKHYCYTVPQCDNSFLPISHRTEESRKILNLKLQNTGDEILIAYFPHHVSKRKLNKFII